MTVGWRVRGWLVAAALLCGRNALAQGTAGTGGAQGARKFDVVSIHLGDEKENNGFYDNNGGRLHVVRLTLKELIEQAYAVHEFQIVGGGSWVETTRYDIEAETDAEVSQALGKKPEAGSAPAPNDSLAARDERERLSRERLQALLMDRFHLKAHVVDKVAPVFSLAVAKNGPKLVKVEKEVGTGRWSTGQLMMSGVTVTRFAQALGDAAGLDRVVLDRTGLGGFYDFALKWSADEAGAADGTVPEGDLPSLSTAIQEQLGLQLKAEKQALPFVVIDGAEKPVPN